jgi:DNA-binding GntR family transcriptional regulator
MSDTLIPRSSLQVDVTNRLRTEIIEGIWRPGARLQERTLAQRYGVSRSPLREAFQVLASERLINIPANRGAIVNAPTPKFIFDNFVLLRTMELLAVRLVCQTATEEDLRQVADAGRAMKSAARSGDPTAFLRAHNDLHRRIVLASGNVALSDMHLVISRQILRIQHLQEFAGKIPLRGIKHYDKVIDAICQRDEPTAAVLFKEHLDHMELRLREALERLSPLPVAAA